MLLVVVSCRIRNIRNGTQGMLVITLRKKIVRKGVSYIKNLKTSCNVCLLACMLFPDFWISWISDRYAHAFRTNGYSYELAREMHSLLQDLELEGSLLDAPFRSIQIPF